MAVPQRGSAGHRLVVRSLQYVSKYLWVKYWTHSLSPTLSVKEKSTQVYASSSALQWCAEPNAIWSMQTEVTHQNQSIIMTNSTCGAAMQICAHIITGSVGGFFLSKGSFSFPLSPSVCSQGTCYCWGFSLLLQALCLLKYSFSFQDRNLLLLEWKVLRSQLNETTKHFGSTLWFKLKGDKFHEEEVARKQRAARVHRAVWRVAASTFHTWTRNSSNVSQSVKYFTQCKRLCVSQRPMLPGHTKVMAKHDSEVTHRFMCSQVTIEVVLQKHAL